VPKAVTRGALEWQAMQRASTTAWTSAPLGAGPAASAPAGGAPWVTSASRRDGATSTESHAATATMGSASHHRRADLPIIKCRALMPKATSKSSTSAGDALPYVPGKWLLIMTNSTGNVM